MFNFPNLKRNSAPRTQVTIGCLHFDNAYSSLSNIRMDLQILLYNRYELL